MEIVLVLVREVALLAMLICLGAFMRKKGVFTADTAQRLADFLILVVTPLLLINTLHREKDPSQVPGFIAAIGFSSLIFFVSALISMFVFRPGKAGERYGAERLAMVLPNCGFMGIPLLLATTGEDSLIYCAGILGPFNILLWGWAIPMINRKRPPLIKLLVSPGVCAFIAGLAIFFLEIRLPPLISGFMGHISALNTPLSMLMIGVFLADVDIRRIFGVRVLKVVFWKNLAIPMMTLLVIYILRIDAMFGRTFALSFQILIACSSAASALLLPVRAGEDGEYPAKLIAASTLASIATLPFVAFVTQKIL